MIQTILGFICGIGVGLSAMWLVMRLRLDAAASSASMMLEWWMDAEHQLDEAHEKHVRAGRTPHERHRERVKDIAAQIAISPPVQLKSRDAIREEANLSLALRRAKLMGEQK